MRYLMILCCCVFLGACKQEVTVPASESAKPKLERQRTTKPGAAVELQHRITSPVALTQPVTVELDVSSSSATADVRVQIQVDDNLSLLSDRSEWQLSLGADKAPATLPVKVALQSGEQGYIHVFVVMASPDGDRVRSFAVPVRLPTAASEKALQKSEEQNPGIIEMPAEEKIY